MNIGTKPKLSHNNLVTCIAYGMNGEVNFCLEGSVYVAGSALQWLRDGMKMIEDAAESEDAANASKDDDEVYVVPAFTGLGAPYWKPNARGAVFGLTRGTTNNDFIKATLQSLAYQTKDLVDAMKEDSGVDIPSLHVDGGAARNNYLLQFQADILGMPVIRAANVESTALGAGFMAGLGVGFWKDQDELKSLVNTGTTVNPKMSEDRRKKLYAGWQQAVKATIEYDPTKN
jgi:glycerol kinase